MRPTANRSITFHYSCIICFLLISSLLLPAWAQDVYLCVWRNPERTMTRIFPDAQDYKTVNVRISPDQRNAIEAKTGSELLPGQQEQFQYFEMTGDNGQVIGSVIAASQKGEYGAIEFVFGMDNDMVIKEIYIQRSRERDKTFKEREFLDLFKGKSARDAAGFKGLYNGDPTVGTDAVIRGLVKELAAYETLVLAGGSQG